MIDNQTHQTQKNRKEITEMAKPILKFTAVPYAVNGHKGYRPLLEQQNPVSDLDFCREVVTEKRLSMSAEELLHALEMVGEVGPKKVAEDGRPRAVTKLLKWNRYAQGNLESPTSPWNNDCKAVIRAQLLADAEKLIDASFTNVNTGIGVKLDNVTWIGAKSVQNVIKTGSDFAAYGRHMEFIADGESPDTAWIELNGTTYDLTNKGSDVSRAVFGYPAALAGIEPGTQVMFWMKSRGGIADGQVYTSKKLVTVIAGDTPTGPTVDDIASEGHEGEIVSGTAFAAKGSGLDAFDAEAGDTVKVKWTQGGEDKEALIDPADIAADKLSFEFPDALVGVPMDTELTFEITFGETLKSKGSKLVES